MEDNIIVVFTITLKLSQARRARVLNPEKVILFFCMGAVNKKVKRYCANNKMAAFNMQKVHLEDL